MADVASYEARTYDIVVHVFEMLSLLFCCGVYLFQIEIANLILPYILVHYVATEIIFFVKSSVFWDITPCRPLKSVNVSEDLIASIFRVEE
jgi:hypothetical protein